MAIGIAIATAVIAAGSLAYSLYIARKAGNNQDGRNPADLNSFQVTQVNEGAVVPLIYGRVRVNSNLLFYGNLVTEAIEEEVGGGKGGGGGSQVVGFNYYLDAWHAVCLGKANIIKTFVNDKEVTIEAGGTLTNDGTQADRPTIPGEFGSKLPGIAWVFYTKWLLGQDVTFVPTIHFVVERVLPTTVSDANLNSGSNPAAVLHDLLLLAGEDPVKINIASFNTAAAFWAGKEYGLNLVFSSQGDASEAIAKVLAYIDGALFVNRIGEWTLKAFDPAEAAVASLTQDDFKDLAFSRKSYHEVWNDFRGSYVDEDLSFTRRIVGVMNDAVIRQVGFKRQLAIELDSFRQLTPASRRLFEIMKRESYPAATLQFTTSLKFDVLQIGDVIEVSHSDYGIVTSSFRVMQIDYTTIDKNELTFKAVQQVETLFDDVFVDIGGSDGGGVDTDLVPLAHQRVFEMPYNSVTERGPAYLLLAAREKGIETAFSVLYSNTGSDYAIRATGEGWAQTGTLDEEYPDTTRRIDNERGILYTPYKEDPIFQTISRTDLFSVRRVALIDNELMAFETVTPEGPSSFRLGGVIRNLLHTGKATHASGARIWLVNFGINNFLTGVSAESFFLKFLPIYQDDVVEASLASAIPVSGTDKAKTPWKIGRLQAIRTGSSIDLIIFPNNQDGTGAGAQPIYQGQAPPFPHPGDFEVIVNGGTPSFETSTNVNINDAGPTDIEVRHRDFGLFGPQLLLSVDTPDGEYINS